MEMEIEIAMNIEIERDAETETEIGRGKGRGRGRGRRLAGKTECVLNKPFSFAQGVLLAVAAVATLAETAVAAEMQSPAMGIGLIRKAMAFRVKYRVSDRKN